MLARERYRAATTLDPQTTAAIIAYVRALDAKGETDEADQAFADAHGRLMAAARMYERSALLLNQSAWVAARCGRRADIAVMSASTSVNLVPGRASTIDTLAEAFAARSTGPQTPDAANARLMMEQALRVATDEEVPTYLRRRDVVQDQLAD